MKTIAQADREARAAATDGQLYVEERGGGRSFQVGRYWIQYHPNGSNEPTTGISHPYVRREDMQDDITTDYWAGHWEKTITAAIRYARRNSAPQLNLVG